jgi:hypothetical protein
MGRLRRELTEPWGVLLAGVVGGVAGVLPGAGLAVGAGVAAAVYGVKVVLGAALGPRGPEVPAPPPRPAQSSAAGIWLRRAERAVEALDAIVRDQPLDSPTASATSHAADESHVVLDTLRRLGAQSVVVAQALRHVDGPDLDAEADRWQRAAAERPDDATLAASARAVADRVAVRDRLRATAVELDARIASSALSLEGLVARCAELRAEAAAVGRLDPTAADLASLTTEVEGLRLGLASVEEATEQALGGS